MTERGKLDRDRGKDKREREEFDFSTTGGPVQIADYLIRIAGGLREGTLILSAAGRAVHLEPAGIVRFEIAAENKPDKGTATLGFELSWRHVNAARGAEEERLIIDSGPRNPLVTAHPSRNDA